MFEFIAALDPAERACFSYPLVLFAGIVVTTIIYALISELRYAIQRKWI